MKRFGMWMGLVVIATALTVSCGDSSDDGSSSNAAASNGSGGKADETGGKAVCDVFAEEGGKIDLANRNDVLAKLVFKSGDTCPTTYSEVMEKLRQTDTENCDSEKNRKAGINTMLVSETAQLMDMPTSYRAAVTRRCDGRKQYDLFFSLFGVRPSGDLPDSVEVIAMDRSCETGCNADFDTELAECKEDNDCQSKARDTRTACTDACTPMFNYYALEGGKWTWFGTSLDLIQPGAHETKRCAGCHTGGGLIMKELHTPWVHWEGHLDIPGAKELVDMHDDLGSKSSGSTMEGIVKSANREWNESRVKILSATKNTKELLRPLFCTVEVNLDNGTDFKDRSMDKIGFDFLLDPTFKGFGGISVKNEDYEELLAALEIFMSSNGSRELTDGDNNAIRDTVFKFTYPERAEADKDFVDKLVSNKIIDDDFKRDALIIDFTTPIWSEERCALLEFTPDNLDTMEADKIRDGFIANIEASSPEEGSAAELFLKNLQTADDKAAHDTTVNTFIDACKAREGKDFLEDALLLAIMRRDRARTEHLFEFAETMPFSNFTVDQGSALNPTTCELESP